MNSYQIIERYYQCFNQANWQGMLDLLDPNVKHGVNESGVESGLEGFAAFLKRMDEHYSEQLHDITIMVTPDGKRAACEYIVEGTYLKTDVGLPAAHKQTYRLAGGAFFELESERITRITNYYNLSAWISQVS